MRGLFLLIALASVACISAKVCDEKATPLTELRRRGRKYDSSSDDVTVPQLEDRYLLSGWYSVPVEGFTDKQYKLTDSTNVPDPLHCGTYEPVYLKEAHPTLVEGEERVVVTCIRALTDQCVDEQTIKIRVCGGKYDYYLEPTPSSSAYCFDREDINEAGIAPPSYSVLRSPSVEVELQYAKGETKIDGKMLEVVTPNLEFYCQFVPDAYVYYVDWYVNDKLVLETGPAEADIKKATALTEDVLLKAKYTLGISIKCAVSAANSRAGLRTNKKFSPGFFAGIKAHEPTSIFLKKGEEGHVNLENTVPIGCEEVKVRGKDTCGVTIMMYDPKSAYTCEATTLSALSDSDQCGVDIKALKYETWFDLSQGKAPCATCSTKTLFNSTLKIITKNDALYDDTLTYTLKLTTGNTAHKIWRNYDIRDIQVTVQNDKKWEKKVCMSHVDPHVTTADGMQYENQQEGTFVMYRNTKYRIEVQERTANCGGPPYCTCSVIVRAGADLFQYSICGDNRNIGFLRCEDNILDVRRINDNKYQVHTPIGTYVEIRRHPWRGNTYLDVDIYMSPKDLGNVEGLCGDFDGQIKNDLRQKDKTLFPDSRCGSKFCNYHAEKFAATWAVDKASFDFRDPKNHRKLQSWSEKQILCVCPFIKGKDGKLLEDIPDKDSDRNRALCSPSEFLTCSKPPNVQGQKKQCTISRRRRSAKSHQLELQQRFEMEHVAKTSVHKNKNCLSFGSCDLMPRHVMQLFKRSTNTHNVTLEKGMEQCRMYLHAQPAYRQFADIMPDSKATDTMIGNCGSDLSYGASGEDLMRGHFEGWKTLNLNEIRRNKTYQLENDETVQNFTESTCLNECNGKGKCVKGVCRCDGDYAGDDCSIVLSDPVDVQYIGGGQLCDRQHDDCEGFNVQAENILDSVTCKVEEIQTFSNDTTETRTTRVLRGSRDSIFAAHCPVALTSNRKKRSTPTAIAFVTQLNIYISNNGIIFGQSGTVYIYDSRCQKYHTLITGQKQFYLAEGFCYIDGICRAYGDIDSSDICFSCQPESNRFSWTNTCHVKKTEKSHLPLIVGLSVGCTALAILTLVGIVYLCKKNTKRNRCATPLANPVNITPSKSNFSDPVTQGHVHGGTDNMEKPPPYS